MKISDLIKELEEVKEKKGNLEILTRDNGFGGYAMHTCNGLSNTNLYAYECAENGNEEIIKELFPEWNGKDESLDDLTPIPCVVINSGTMLYAT